MNSLYDIALALRRVWIIATLGVLVAATIVLLGAPPEKSKPAIVVLLANVAQGAAVLGVTTLGRLLGRWKLTDRWYVAILSGVLAAVGGGAFIGLLIAVGAVVLLFEFCAPYWPLVPYAR